MTSTYRGPAKLGNHIITSRDETPVDPLSIKLGAHQVAAKTETSRSTYKEGKPRHKSRLQRNLAKELRELTEEAKIAALLGLSCEQDMTSEWEPCWEDSVDKDTACIDQTMQNEGGQSRVSGPGNKAMRAAKPADKVHLSELVFKYSEQERNEMLMKMDLDMLEQDEVIHAREFR